MRHAFALQRPAGKGTTEADHLAERARRRDGAEARAQLIAPRYPASARYLLDWFYELHARRGYTQHGPLPLSWSDMDAWARRTKRDPWRWEWLVIGLLDHAFLSPDETTDAVKTTTHDAAWPEAKSA